jgi:hypothetical protein
MRIASGEEILIARVVAGDGRVGFGFSFRLDATEARHMAEWQAGLGPSLGKSLDFREPGRMASGAGVFPDSVAARPWLAARRSVKLPPIVAKLEHRNEDGNEGDDQIGDEQCRRAAGMGVEHPERAGNDDGQIHRQRHIYGGAALKDPVGLRKESSDAEEPPYSTGDCRKLELNHVRSSCLGR